MISLDRVVDAALQLVVWLYDLGITTVFAIDAWLRPPLEHLGVSPDVQTTIFVAATVVAVITVFSLIRHWLRQDLR